MNMLLEIHLLMREGSKTTKIWYAVGQVVAGQECCLPGHGAVTARCCFFFVFFFSYFKACYLHPHQGKASPVIISQFNALSKLSFTAAWLVALGMRYLQTYKITCHAACTSDSTRAPGSSTNFHFPVARPVPDRKMSLSHTAAEYMLSDALLPDPSGSRAKGLRLELPSDRMLKFIAVGLPLFLVSLAFAREFSAGSQISCFSPSNFTGKQSAYADTACWDSLLHHGFDAEGHAVTKSLWVLKVFPYSLLVVAVLMYLPYLLWRYAATPALHSDLLFIIDELDKSYNRSVRLVQHMRKVQQSSTEPEQFWEEYERARQERYFEFPLLERYLVCKQHSHSLVIIYLLRNLLLLLFLAATCLYLVFLHLNIFFQDEFSCSIKTGLLQAEPHVPPLIPCKLVFFSVFQLISLTVGGVYVLLMPVVIYNALQLCQWDKGFLSVYEMLPAFDLLSRKMLTCPINDLNIILLFLRANISELTSFSRLSAVSALREATADKQDIDTVVDFMTLLAGLEASKPKYEACVPMANEMKPGAEAKGKATRDSLGSA
ncbi:pannexin-3 isoform X2 [Anas acuta]|uniref:pannexin-3 isoform X2 n=1 Tax=Anas acuta TaxID=28680 RepID=UPI0035C8FB9E